MSLSHGARQRIFKMPKLRFNFERYFEMINGQNTAVTEPPVMLCVDSSTPIIEERIKTKMPPQQLFTPTILTSRKKLHGLSQNKI